MRAPVRSASSRAIWTRLTSASSRSWQGTGVFPPPTRFARAQSPRRLWNAQGRVRLDEIVINSPVEDRAQERKVAIGLIAGTAIHDFMDCRHHVAFRDRLAFFAPKVGRRFVASCARLSPMSGSYFGVPLKPEQSEPLESEGFLRFAGFRGRVFALPRFVSVPARKVTGL